MKKVLWSFILTGFLFAVFLVLMLLVLYVDLQSAGPENSIIGLATMNLNFAEIFAYNSSWYEVSEVLGYLFLIVPVSFVGVGIYQIIKRKSVKGIDFHLITLAFIYLLFVLFYVLFMIFAVNYRPVIFNGELESSFPSTHIMIATVFGGTAILDFPHLIKNKTICLSGQITIGAVALITVLGRILSGAHWLTDLIGGLLLGLSLVMLYISLNNLQNWKMRKRKI